MSEISTADERDPRASASGGSNKAGAPRRRGVSFLGLFFRQVVAELRKVVRPTRNELVTYTSVVLVFVTCVMAFVSSLDFGFGHLVLYVFGGKS